MREPVAATAIIRVLRWIWVHTEVTPQGCSFRVGRLAICWARAGMRPKPGFVALEKTEP